MTRMSRHLSRRNFLSASGIAVGLAAATTSAPPASAAPTPELVFPILSAEAPRGFYLRTMEGASLHGSMPPETWIRTFGRLDGVEAKLLNEAGYSPRRSRLLYYFNALKRARPGQLTLLHISGHGRVPDGPLLELGGKTWFPVGSIPVQHWLYRPATALTKSVAAGDRILHISQQRWLSPVEHGFGDDVLIVDRDRWSNAEHARILDIDRAHGTITVARGKFGTRALAHPAGSRVLPHVGDRIQNDGGSESWLWFYNFSTACPVDTHGRRAGAIVADQLAQLFAGPFAHLDGLEFDVDIYALSPSLSADTNVDGLQDDGDVGHRNVWGAGFTAFLTQLRNDPALRNKLILADHGSIHSRPPSSALNGVESEGWPTSADPGLYEWSGGLNRLLYWQTHALRNKQGCPSLNYIVLKQRGDARVTPSQTRVLAAIAAFTGMPLAMSEEPYTTDSLGPVIDELTGGSTGPGHGSLGWLGRAVGAGQHPVLATRDLMSGYGTRWASLRALNPDGCTVSRDDRPNRPIALKLTPHNPSRIGDKWQNPSHPPFVGPDSTFFSITTPNFRLNVPPGAPHDLVVQCTFDGPDLVGYPGLDRLVLIRLRWDVRDVANFITHYTWAGDLATAHQPSIFYFRDLHFPGDSVLFSMTITAECGDRPMWLTGLTAHAGPDFVYREFERGVVLVNPSSQPHQFPTSQWFGSRRGLTRLHWSPGQPRDANTGAAIAGPTVPIPAKDALFLRFR